MIKFHFLKLFGHNFCGTGLHAFCSGFILKLLNFLLSKRYYGCTRWRSKLSRGFDSRWCYCNFVFTNSFRFGL